MFDIRTTSLINVSTLSSRPEYQSELIEELRNIKDSSCVTKAELYEIFLQSYLFAGFPAALESVRALEKVFGREPREIKNQDEMISAYKDHAVRGEALYKKVYAGNAPRVREEMIRLSPELAAWAMIEGYGKTLSRPQLDTKTRELANVGMLTQLGWQRQLYSHILGAYNVGAIQDEIAEAALIGSKGSKERFEIAEQLIKKIV
jgi:alkylhydroperoxidase/carboxymuconolactone decarboxylase family protein YurZ